MIKIDFAGQDGTPFAVYECHSDGAIIRPLFVPHSRQIKFLASKKSRVLFGGGRGGGKTEVIVWKPIETAYLVPGCKMICFRRTMGELRKTVIQRFIDLPKGLFERVTEDAVRFDNGSILWFGSADDEKAVRKMLSGEYFLIEIDEWSEWPLSMWKFMEGSLRAPVEQDIFGNPVTPQLIGATNPGGVGGEALNALFGCDGRQKRQAPGEDPTLYDASDYEFIQSLVSDNPAYSADKPAGIAYRKMLMSQPRRIRAAWLEGRWDGFEGQYFDCLDESVTRISHDDFLRLIKRQHWAPRWISIDWGMTHHASVGWHALLEIGNRQFPVTYAGYLTKGIGEAALAQEICDQNEHQGDKGKVIRIYLSPETFGDTAYSRARRMGDVFVQNGLPRPVPANNKREDGWRLMHDLLRARYENVDIYGNGSKFVKLAGWLITDHRVYPVPEQGDNPHPIECLTQAVCDPKHDGDVLKEGDAVHLDVNDQLRYGIASHISPVEEPYEDRLKDELSQLPVEGTARFIKHLEMQKAEREKNSGAVYLGGLKSRRKKT